MPERVTHAANDTAALAEELAGEFRGGEVVLLEAELGGGKTAFVKGLGRALGVDEDDVSSPTFVLLTSYAGRLTLHHADLYRLDCAGDELELELEELPGPKGVLAIEWAERLSAARWPRRLRVRLEHLGGDERRVTWAWEGAEEGSGRSFAPAASSSRSG